MSNHFLHDAEPLQLDALYEATIEKLVYGGAGLARVNGQTVFVPLTAPGDHVRLRIVSVERNFARGEIVALLQPSPVRRTPPCAHFGVCGGCQLQHVDYGAQVAAKAEFVRESLQRIGQIEWTGEIATRTAAEFGYRARAELKVERAVTGRAQLGYFKAGTHELCAIDECPILLPAANRALQRVQRDTDALPPAATRVFLTAGDAGVLITPGTGEQGRAQEYDAQGTVTQRIGKFDYRFGARSFFQGNALLVNELVNCVVGQQHGGLALDLYAGVGLFALPLARQFAQVIAVEGNRSAVAHGVFNAQANGVANVAYQSLSVEAWLKYQAHRHAAPDFVVLDPPRQGAGKAVMERLAELAPPEIVYVSCDPTTLARDLRTLLSLGYHSETITTLDLFPQTYHVETVVHLRSQAASVTARRAETHSTR